MAVARKDTHRHTHEVLCWWPKRSYYELMMVLDRHWRIVSISFPCLSLSLSLSLSFSLSFLRLSFSLRSLRSLRSLSLVCVCLCVSLSLSVDGFLGDVPFIDRHAPTFYRRPFFSTLTPTLNPSRERERERERERVASETPIKAHYRVDKNFRNTAVKMAADALLMRRHKKKKKKGKRESISTLEKKNKRRPQCAMRLR